MAIRIVIVVLAGLIAALSAGCEGPSKDKPHLLEKVSKLQKEKNVLADQLKQAREENEQLTGQIAVLSELPGDIRAANVYDILNVKLTSYTGIYDKDKDGKKEKLVVYIQPIDVQGDVIKAAGKVDIQLWDLGKKEVDSLIGEWHVDNEELKKNWFEILMINYRLMFDVGDKIKGTEDELTVRITFTDYLSGKVFKTQKVVKL